MTVTDKQAMKKRKHQEVEDDDDVEDDNDVSTSSSSDDEDEEEEVQTLHIVVRRVGKSERESLQVMLDSDASVLDLKEKIAQVLEEQEEAAIPTERQRLIFAGKMLRDDNQSLATDLHMKAGDQKHFVHLTPLPKGAAPSVRTERELSDNPTASAHEERSRRFVERQQRRRRRLNESSRQPGMMDPAAYHPYALDLTSGNLLPPAATESTVAALEAATAAAAAEAAATTAAIDEAARLQVAAAAEQTRLLQEVARRNVLPDAAALEAMVLAQQQQQQQLLAAATEAGNAAAAANASAAMVNALCPMAGQADTATSLLESALFAGRSSAAPAAASLLAYAPHQLQQQQQQQTLEAAALAAALPAGAATTAAGLGALQDALNLSSVAGAASTNTQQQLPEILDQIAANAGELATTLRLLSPAPAATPAAASLATAAAVPTPVSLPTTPSAITSAATSAFSAATTPQDLATRLALEERLRQTLTASGGSLQQHLAAAGGLSGLF